MRILPFGKEIHEIRFSSTSMEYLISFRGLLFFNLCNYRIENMCMSFASVLICGERTRREEGRERKGSP